MGVSLHNISPGRSEHTDYCLACYNMREAIEFSAKHNIKPHMTAFKFEEVPKMIELMNAHKAQGRMGVVFD